ncbi:HAMP domain-containing histidine kinase [Pseudolysobacter antarcticus]|uniref:histidine kinase n=1 Tax=Pseudolysobacter antarcticus TaxID=2511995 RepID=A0A411HLR2_9GAMM|nr:HAMP domain-containing sensor histidine kinase [Pseudolysobacter antarcticus]QBB71428.1 HAMP domain-containing histidine kinase [Pseudolysobacter antarcticus]
MATLADRWRTSAFRLTAIFGALFVVWVIVLLGITYWQTAGYMTRQVDQILRVESENFRRSGEAQLAAKVTASVANDERHIFLYGLFAADGAWRAGNLESPPRDLPEDGEIHHISGRDSGVKYDTSSEVRALAIRVAGGQLLVIGRDVAQLDEFRRIVFRAFVWGAIATILLTLLGGLALSVGPLRRIAQIRQTAQTIIAGNIKNRLPLAQRGDELDMLAGIVNTMLDQIEQLMAEAQGVGDNIAHDLRTPLTRLRALLYRAEQRTDLTDEHRPMLEQAIAETDALLARFRALQRIAEIEDRHRRAAFTQIELESVLRQIRDLYEPLAEEKNIALTLACEAVANVLGDAELLFEALSNLIDNAIKFTPSDGRIEMRLLQADGGAKIEITDSGPGIAANERDAVLQRFYRSENSRQLPGSGLGLSLVSAIVRLHGFTLEFDDAEHGLRVSLLCWPRVVVV